MHAERTHVPDPDVIEVTRTRSRRSKGQARIGLNLTAMIDVVFLLLVYFMVATEFKLGEEIYPMDLPERRQSNQQRDPFDLDDEPLRIELASTGLGRNAYRVIIDGPYAQPRSFDDLFEFLTSRRIDEGGAGGLFEDDHPIVIAPTSTCRWEHVVEAFSVAARARYTNITFQQAGSGS